MARQISVLIEDQSLRRQELEGLRRQLEASTTSALDAQSRLQAYSDGPGRTTLSASCLLAAVTVGNETEDPGTGTTTVRTDPNDCQADDPGTVTISVGIDLIVRRDQDDLGAGTTSVGTDPSDCQAPEDPGTRMTTTKADLIISII